MNKKKLAISFVFLSIIALLFALSISQSSALYAGNMTIYSISKIGGNITINVTYDQADREHVSGEVNRSLLFLSVGSPSTANTSVTVTPAGGIGNSSGAGQKTNSSLFANFVFSFNTTHIEDSNDYTITAILTNTSAGSTKISKTVSLTVDNTVPQAATSLLPTSITNGTNILFRSTVVGSNATSCVLVFTANVPGTLSRSNTMTHSGNTCTLSGVTVPASTYRYIVQSGDSTNYTNSTEATLTSSITGSGAASAAAVLAQSSGSGTSLLAIFKDINGNPKPIPIVIGIVVVLFIVYLFKKK